MLTARKEQNLMIIAIQSHNEKVATSGVGWGGGVGCVCGAKETGGRTDRSNEIEKEEQCMKKAYKGVAVGRSLKRRTRLRSIPV